MIVRGGDGIKRILTRHRFNVIDNQYQVIRILNYDALETICGAACIGNARGAGGFWPCLRNEG